MELQKLIKDYINHCLEQSQFATRSLERYSYLLNIYYEFLTTESSIHSETLMPYFSGITADEVFKSLEYYIDRRPVKSEDTARLYISVVKEFFRYLSMSGQSHSPRLIESFGLGDDNPQSFNYRLGIFLDDLHKSNKISVRSKDKIPTEAEVKDIIDCCNQFTNLDEIKRLPDKEDAHNRFVKSLVVKLILLTGIKFSSRIKSIKKSDLDLDNGTLTLEKFMIHLPYNYRINMNDYMKIRYCSSDDTSLFLFYDGKPVSQPNELVSVFSYKANLSSTTSLAKYAMLELLDANVDKDTIIDFTGYGETVYNSCKELSDLGKMENKIQLIDRTIKCLPLFDII